MSAQRAREQLRNNGRALDAHLRQANAQPTCPAGEVIAEVSGGQGCRCRIEQETIVSQTSPTTLAKFCYAAYTACPTWRSQRDTA